ncbi:MAG: AraC family transcriptional regulator [Ignavibacteriales bacterium]|nr:MAG: AraC family transcriptional regulator [Ignavibacteriales bacterium]
MRAFSFIFELSTTNSIHLIMNKETSKAEYASRINKVLDYIENNLDKDLSLNNLASLANFSPFYFHRIFSAIIGETLNGFIQRIKIEKAAMQLVMNPKKSITEIALDCGFSSSSSFARSFKEYFGISATEWREDEELRSSKICKTNDNIGKPKSKDSKEFGITSMYLYNESNNLIWRLTMIDKKELNVVVKDMPETELAYVRHIGPYQGNPALFESLINKLCKWAGPRGLLKFPETKIICVYHDNPDVTEDSKLRLSVCINVDPGTKADGEFGIMKIPAGKYAIARFELESNEYKEAWELVYGGWLPESGFQPADGLCFEMYHNDPKTHPKGLAIVDICIPVMPL